MLSESVQYWFIRKYPSWKDDWSKFCTDFHRFYTPSTRTTALGNRALTVVQLADEPLLSFVNKKFRQLTEFHSHMGEAEMICRILPLIHRKYDAHLGGRTFFDYNTFIEACNSAKDVVECDRSTHVIPASASESAFELQPVRDAKKKFDKADKTEKTDKKVQFKPTFPRRQSNDSFGKKITSGAPSTEVKKTGSTPAVSRPSGSPANKSPGIKSAIKKPDHSGYKCFNCDKTGHLRRDCPSGPNKQNLAKAKSYITTYLETEGAQSDDEEDILFLEDSADEAEGDHDDVDNYTSCDEGADNVDYQSEASDLNLH
jgi:hypothetical protein